MNKNKFIKSVFLKKGDLTPEDVIVAQLEKGLLIKLNANVFPVNVEDIDFDEITGDFKIRIKLFTNKGEDRTYLFNKDTENQFEMSANEFIINLKTMGFKEYEPERKKFTIEDFRNMKKNS